MNRIWSVAVREFAETVKTKMFIISVVLMPVMIIGFVFATGYVDKLGEQEAIPPRRLGVVDRSGKVVGPLADKADEYNERNPNRPFEIIPLPADDADMDALRAEVNSGEYYAMIEIPEDAVAGEASCTLVRSDNQLRAGEQIEDMVTEAIVDVRFTTHEPPIDQGIVSYLQRRVPFELIEAKSGLVASGNEIARIMTPFAFMFLMWMGTLSISQGLLTSVIEEKSSRVVEVLLSAVSPLELMAGKIIGMVMVGGVLLCVWGSAGYMAADSRDMAYLVTSYRLTVVVLYFIPGFLFSAAFLAGVGSVCNTIKDAQSMTFPLSILTIVPMLMWFYITEYPTSAVSVALSYVPPITPYIMILRVCADPGTPVWQIATTLIVLWAAVFGVIWAAAKIFRIGVLMYGKAPTPRELMRWLRYA